MKPWRPSDWALIKRRMCDRRLAGGAKCETCPANPQTCDVGAEAAADAILKSLEPLIRDIAPSSKLVDILYPKEIAEK